MLRLEAACWLVLSFGMLGTALGQSAGAGAAQPAVSSGGTIHGTIKSGNVPLPGVTVTATNTLTGKKYSAATDIRGEYRMSIPENGRYVVRTEFAAFASLTREALLNGNAHDQVADFSLLLASRARQQEQREERAFGFGEGRGERGGMQNLSLLGAASDLIQAGAGGESGGAALPSLAGNSDFSNASVAVSGQNGTESPLAGLDMDQLRRNYQSAELNNSLSAVPGEAPGEGEGGGGFGGGHGFGGGGFGGHGGHGFGGGGGGFRNFRNLKLNQPHGAFFWTGGNGALNATDFPLRGQPITEPAYSQNKFGLTFLGAPYIPKLLEHDRKDFLFFTFSGQHSSSPYDEYGTVPTAAERAGNFSQLVSNGTPITIYNPATGQPYPNNTITTGISPVAQAMLQYVPLPNLSGQSQNYQRLTTAQTNTTKLGARFIHNFGGGSGGSPIMGMIRQYMGQGGPGIRQNISLNYNYEHTAEDELNLFPDLGGKEQMHQNSLQLGYTLGRGRLTNNFNLSWNRTNTQLTNNFTNGTDVASQLGLAGLSTDPRLYGLPDVTLDQFTSISEQQPNQELQQTVALSESSIWNHKKHNLRWGGDFRRVYLDDIGYLGGQASNVTGNYTFTGIFTEQPGTSGTNGGVGTTNSDGTPTTGSSLADFLLGMPQETTIQAPYQETHLRENTWDAYVQDDWRPLRHLTLLYGLRYEYYSPYSERNDRLATLDTGNDFASVATVVANGVGPYTGKYPRGLIYPEHNNFAPRLGFAWSAFHDTVIRGGYGVNYAVGQYAKFVQDLAFQPPFADVQTNEFTTGSPGNLTNGFPAPQAYGNWAIDKNYRLPYVQVWNLNVQRTVPWGVVINVGYSGSKGSRLDVVDAPGRTATTSESGVYYDYEQATAFSNYNALTVSARKRLSGGISLQARYTYSHSIDDASSIGGNGGSALVVAQNWQNLRAEESNSSFDIRHQVVGNFVYELPFGPDRHMLTTGWLAKAVENLSVSGTYDLATGEPLTPSYEAAASDVARGTIASLRPDRVAGVPLMKGGGSLDNWFNKAAFASPADVYGTASRYSIPGPGTVSVDMSLSKTVRFSDTRTFEVRATADNAFNTVQYSGIDTTVGSQTYGYVTSTAAMRQFTFLARLRY